MSRSHLIARWTLKVLLAGLLCAWGVDVQAAPQDSVVMTVTPGGVLYAVTITSPSVNHPGYDFSQVTLGATTISTRPISVKNTGNISEYFAVAVSNTAPDNWTAIPSGTPGYNEFKLFGRFVDGGNAQPADSSFDVNVDTITASIPAAAVNRYGQAQRTIPDSSIDLYLKLVMPQSVATTGEQHMTLTINGQSN